MVKEVTMLGKSRNLNILQGRMIYTGQMGLGHQVALKPETILQDDTETHAVINHVVGGQVNVMSRHSHLHLILCGQPGGNVTGIARPAVKFKPLNGVRLQGNQALCIVGGFSVMGGDGPPSRRFHVKIEVKKYRRIYQVFCRYFYIFGRHFKSEGHHPVFICPQFRI